MARVLADTSPARGHLYPVAQTLPELRGRGRGHEVHVRTLASEVRAFRDVGLRAERVAAEIERQPLDDWRGETPEEALGGIFRTFAARSVRVTEGSARAGGVPVAADAVEALLPARVHG